MKNGNRNLLKLLACAHLAWLGSGTLLFSQVRAAGSPPAGHGIAATLQTDQNIYTNTPPGIWCPPCVTNVPPCRLPCYLIDGSVTAKFMFAVSNQYDHPRVFQFRTSQQFDVAIMDQTGAVVAMWSDGQTFQPMATAFTLDPGQVATFIAEMRLEDRNRQPLSGVYQAVAFLTTSGPFPRVQAEAMFGVAMSP